jgi:hypothetical protein
MIYSFMHRIAAASILAAVSLVATAQTPAPNTTAWESDTLNLRLFYPSDLVKSDSAQVMHDGHLTLSGISGTADPQVADATHCLRPILLLEHPASSTPDTAKPQPAPDGGLTETATAAASATVLLAELDLDCLTPEQQMKATNLLSEMAETVNKVPGMKSIAQPSTYTIGWQKVHMAAAQGVPSGAAAQLYTMGISTNWNSHLLVWYFSSNNIDALNRITKTTVRFGRAQAEPLYPVAIGTTAR